MLTDEVIDDELVRTGVAVVDEHGFSLKIAENLRFAEYDEPVAKYK
jgi:hypothetical protein